MKRISYLIIIAVIFTLFVCGKCQRISEGSVKHAKQIKPTVTACFETEPMKNVSTQDDAADDPAIWINENKPDESLIIGTDKKTGLAVYNLQGKELHFYKHGKMNNVDVRYNFPYMGKNIDIVACSNRTDKTINIYKINSNGSLEQIETKGFEPVMKENVYGFCLGKDTENNKFYAFANSKKGEFVQWEFKESKNKIIEAKVVRKLQFNGKLEGMVADDISKTIFVGEEDACIWHTAINPKDQSINMIKSSNVETNKKIKADIEGLAIYRGNKNNNYLLASSQGNYSYAVFEFKPPYKYICSFRIVDSKQTDGAEETDGIEVTSVALNSQFKQGILVVQDGFNYDDKQLKSQNFKIVDWGKIQNIIDSESK